MGDLRPKPLIDFKAYPHGWGGKLYFRVKVFDTKKNMQAHVQLSEDKGKHYGDFEGLCNACDRRRKGKLLNQLGTIYLHQRRLGGSVVSHEAVHAAMRYLERKGIDLNKKTSVAPGLVFQEEEDLCYAVGEIVKQIYEHVYDSKIARPGDRDTG